MAFRFLRIIEHTFQTAEEAERFFQGNHFVPLNGTKWLGNGNVYRSMLITDLNFDLNRAEVYDSPKD